MGRLGMLGLGAVMAVAGCRQPAAVQAAEPAMAGPFVGFDRNIYPGDERVGELRKRFSFAGYWLTAPPGESATTWVGKRKLLRDAGFGFLVLANGRLDARILAVQGKGAKVSAGRQGREDATEAVAAARREGFSDGTIIFLDQEEGGRLLPEQAEYFLAWTEAVAGSAYKPGAYVSGQPSPDGKGPDGRPVTITTAQDVRERIARGHLHAVALWVAQDACPPAPGCVVKPPTVSASGIADAMVWQYAQSPRRAEITRACAKSYGADGNCYAGGSGDLSLDLDTADSADPSHGR